MGMAVDRVALVILVSSLLDPLVTINGREKSFCSSLCKYYHIFSELSLSVERPNLKNSLAR